jgi:hypothetical protein
MVLPPRPFLHPKLRGHARWHRLDGGRTRAALAIGGRIGLDPPDGRVPTLRVRRICAISARHEDALEPHTAATRTLTVRFLAPDVERIYAAFGVSREKKGTPIGAHDMLIAAHARAIAAVCVTDNLAEFERVPALEGEHWLR